MATEFALGSFALGSFESPLSISEPGNSLARCYFVVRESQGSCDQILCDPSGQLALLSQEQVRQLGAVAQTLSEQYLGHNHQQQYWVAIVSDSTSLNAYVWQGLRAQLGMIDEAAFSLAGRALQIAQWFFDHAYCGRCGGATGMDEVDRAKVCARCHLRFYPRISPCMIVLITQGDKLLLAHHARSSKPIYTTLAGFVEAGERVEDTVRREVMEEVGVTLGRISYFGSQSWPFPAQLMLGFIAEYESGEIRIDHQEILDANWFAYDQLPLVPPKATVAGQLIDYYVQGCIEKHQNH
jgi:NAD+ diphosphatase